MTFVHPDYRCPGCDRPIEPLAQVRMYHTQCDPQGRLQMLERALRGMLSAFEATLIEPHSYDKRWPLVKAARAALAHKPAQMKAREE